MTKIEQVNDAKYTLQRFKRWFADMIGREYFGGTRGIGGKFGSVVSATFTATVYFQEYEAAKTFGPQIIAEAERLLTERVKTLADAATAEARAVLADTTEALAAH